MIIIFEVDRKVCLVFHKIAITTHHLYENFILPQLGVLMIKKKTLLDICIPNLKGTLVCSNKPSSGGWPQI